MSRKDRGRRWKPKRLFRQARPTERDDEFDRLLEELRRTLPRDEWERLEDAVDTLDTPAFWRVVRHMPSFERAALLLSWRDACDAIREGKPCDFCPTSTARHVRFLGILKDLSTLGVPTQKGRCAVGFTICCDDCRKLSDFRFEQRAIEFARTDLAGKDMPEPYWHPTAVGVRIGDPIANRFPRERSLQECTWCNRTIWVADAARDAIIADRGTPKFVCLDCAKQPPAGQRIECVVVPSGPLPPP
jgi:hypothetical protein